MSTSDTISKLATTSNMANIFGDCRFKQDFGTQFCLDPPGVFEVTFVSQEGDGSATRKTGTFQQRQ